MDEEDPHKPQDFSEFADFSAAPFEETELQFEEHVELTFEDTFETFQSADFITKQGQDQSHQSTTTTVNKFDVQQFVLKCFPNPSKAVVSSEGSVYLESLSSQITKDSLFSNLISIDHGPVSAKLLNLTTLKDNTVRENLQSYQHEEGWRLAIEQVVMGRYRKKFDYHKLIKTSKPQSKIKENVILSTPLDHATLAPELKSLDADISDLAITNDEIPLDIIEDEKNKQSIAIYDKEEQTDLHNELMEKSVDDLKKIVMELEIEAKIYSELLLSELNYRDRLKRNVELRNSFIASHLAVEQKLNEKEKRKKKGYSLFRYSEDDSKTQLYTVPYIHNDNGPSNAQLALMIEILKSIERDDEKTPKLISDYVMSLADEHNLDTVIKVRTSNGLTTINSPGTSTS